MRLEDQVAEVIADRAGRVEVSPPDVAEVVRRGQLRQRRRRVVRDGVAALVVVAVAATALTHVRGDRPGGPAGPGEPEQLRPVGALELDDGLRAVASPDGGLLLGGRTVPAQGAPDLDTAATATPYGMVFFDSAGHARLLDGAGEFVDLGGPAAPAPAGYRPTSGADATRPWVAFTLPASDGVTVVLHDLAEDRRVAELQLDCGGCDGVGVDAVDRGLVFLRDGGRSVVWDVTALGSDREVTELGSGDFRLADARGGRLLWSGAPPVPGADSPVAGWPTIEGPVDARLSFDGGHVLDWSNVLQPTTAGGRPVRLDVQAVFYAFDTDGSVLAATLEGEQSTVHDCEVPSGRCVVVGTVPTASGDPVFLGADQ